MSRGTTTQIISADRVKAYLEQRDTLWRTPRRTSSSPTPATAAVELAVSDWYEFEAERGEDALTTSPTTTAPTTQRTGTTTLHAILENYTGDTMVIPLIANKHAKQVTETVTVTASASELSGLHPLWKEAPSKRTNHATIRLVQRRGLRGVVKAVLTKMPRAVKAKPEPISGALKTVYELVYYPRVYSAQTEKYASMAEARAAADAYLTAHPECLSATVTAHVVREGGDDRLLVLQRPQDERPVTLKVTRDVVAPDAEPVEYLVVFQYYC